jgi:hypothetical protein
MSYPTVPNITPTISIDYCDAVNLLLMSIAMEEIGLSHIINAEAEKIQYVLGTLHGTGHSSATVDDLLKINKDVRQTLQEVVRKELLLQMKLETVLCSPPPCPTVTPTPQPQPPCPPDQASGGASYPAYR